MVPKVAKTDAVGSAASETVEYIADVLGQLRQLAARAGEDRLCYFIEMAFIEAGELHARIQQGSVLHGKRY